MGASNCPETPRQKMIQMMYLVYTAMLALNVAAEVVNGFVTVGDAMSKSNENIELKLEDSYNNFTEAHKNNPEKTQECYDKALQVQKLSLDLRNFIDSMQYDFLCTIQSSAEIVDYSTGKKVKHSVPLRDKSGNHLLDSAKVALQRGGLSVIDKKDDNHSGSAYFYGSKDKASGKSVELKERIIQFKKDLKNILGEDSASLQVAMNVEGEYYSAHEKKMVPWDRYNFDNTITIADMVVLSSLKAESMNAEFDAVNMLYKQVKEGDFSFDKIAVISRPKSTYIIQGGTYETDINIAAYDSKATFEAEIGGSKYTSNDSGSVNVRRTCGATGQQTISGKVYVKGDKGVETYEFKDSYFVAEPVAVIELTNMNVVYVGVDNPVSIGVPGVDSRNITPSIAEATATIVKDPSGKAGLYIIKPTKMGKINVTVNAKVDGKTNRNMGTKLYRAKAIPQPTLKIGNFKSGDAVSKAELLANPVLRPDMGDFDFKLATPLKISSFSFNVSGSGATDITEQGNRLSPEMQNRIKNAKRGQKVYIDNVTIKTPDGRTHNLSLTLKLK